MTGLPAACSALAFASTARVADSAMPAMRREMRRWAGGSSEEDADECGDTAVMGPSCQRGRARTRSRAPEVGRWLCRAPVPYTGRPGAPDPATGVPRNLCEAPRCRGEAG